MTVNINPSSAFFAGSSGKVGSVISSGLYNGANGSSYITAANPLADSALIVNQGKMTVTVPLDVNGLDVEQVLRDLMAVTGVVARNRKLEEKYKGLKEAGEVYQEVLQSIQNDVNIKIKEAADRYRYAEEKYKTLEIIKESK